MSNRRDRRAAEKRLRQQHAEERALFRARRDGFLRFQQTYPQAAEVEQQMLDFIEQSRQELPEVASENLVFRYLEAVYQHVSGRTHFGSSPYWRGQR